MLLAGVIAGEVAHGGGGGKPALIAHVAKQQASSFSQPGGTTSPINTTGANFLAMAINAYDNQFSAAGIALVADGFGAVPTVMDGSGGDSYTGSSLTINGTFTAGASNAFVGLIIAVAGYSSVTGNNGYWICTASSTTSITVTVPGSSAQGSTTGVKCALSANKWVRIPDRVNDFGGGCIFYAVNATVGANHYFIEDDRTINNAGDGSSYAVVAFSNVQTTSTYMQNQRGSKVSSGTAVAGASITPTTNNLLLSFVSGLTITGGESVDSGFTTTDVFPSGTRVSPIGLAYLVPGSGSPLTPSWTVGSVGNSAYAQCVEFAHA